MKKNKFVLILLVALSLLIVACGSTDGGSGENGESNELVLSTWGFNEELLRKNIYEPFEKEHNVKIVLEVGNNADRLNKIRMDNNVDVIQLAEGFTVQAINEGLIEEINPDNIPNLEELYDFAKAPFGAQYGPSNTIDRFGIMYDSDQVDIDVDSWDDLWDDSLTKQVTIPDITTTSGPMIPYIAADIEGLDIKTDIDAVFNKIKALDDNLVKIYSKSSEVVNMFTQKEVALVSGLGFAYGQIKEAVPTVKWVDPKEGSYAAMNSVNVVKGSKNKDLAEKFINWLISEEVQKANAVDRVDSPANKTVVLTDEQAEGLAYGKETIEKLNVVDWQYIYEVNKEWIDKWNKEISGGN